MARRNDVEKLIQNYERRLQKLKEVQSLQGLDTSPQTLMDIEDTETKIEELRIELDALAAGGPGLETSSEGEPDSVTSTQQPRPDNVQGKSQDAESKLTPIRRRHLEQRSQALQNPLRTYHDRVDALQNDIVRELDGERRMILEERLADVERKRREILAELEEIERQLGISL